MSGTAAKLARTGAYHHCTLLVRVDTISLHEALNNPASGPGILETNATRSLRSPVENLANLEAGVNAERLIQRMEEAIASQCSEDMDILDVDPYEDSYVGLEKIVRSYESWDWIFGKSPKFTVNTCAGNKYDVINGLVEISGSKEKFSHELLDKGRSYNRDLLLLSESIKDII